MMFHGHLEEGAAVFRHTDLALVHGTPAPVLFRLRISQNVQRPKYPCTHKADGIQGRLGVESLVTPVNFTKMLHCQGACPQGKTAVEE